MSSEPNQRGRRAHWRRNRVLYLLLIVCAAPVVASYVAYYVVPPSGRTNYGELIDQRPLPALAMRDPDARPFDLRSLNGRWIMLTVSAAACASPCREHLWKMRQLRLAAGKDSDRIERALLVIDDGPLAETLLSEHPGLRVLRTDDEPIRRFLHAADGFRIEDHVFLVDPVGHLMLRWPAGAEPRRMRKDLTKLLKASRVG